MKSPPGGGLFETEADRRSGLTVFLAQALRLRRATEAPNAAIPISARMPGSGIGVGFTADATRPNKPIPAVT